MKSAAPRKLLDTTSSTPRRTTVLAPAMWHSGRSCAVGPRSCVAKRPVAACRVSYAPPRQPQHQVPTMHEARDAELSKALDLQPGRRVSVTAPLREPDASTPAAGVALQLADDELPPSAHQLLAPGWKQQQAGGGGGAAVATDAKPRAAGPADAATAPTGSSGLRPVTEVHPVVLTLATTAADVVDLAGTLRQRATGLLGWAMRTATTLSAKHAHAALQTPRLAPAPAEAAATRKLKAQLDALQAHVQSLEAELEEAQRRTAFAESQAASVSTRLETGRALHAVDRAAQLFRRHVAGLPAAVAPDQFFEREQDIIGKGGCATVYRWGGGSSSASTDGAGPNAQEWAVKVDPISYRYSRNWTFEPERCADLLPAFLPPHPCIMAPKAWWVGTMPRPAGAPQPVGSLTSAGKHPGTAIRSSSSPGLSAISSSGLGGGATGFKLYTLYDRFPCSLWEMMQQQMKAAGGAASANTALPRLDLRSLLVVVRDVASALAHLQANRVVHCDVKAENVLLTLTPDDGSGGPRRVTRAVLIDFGLARLLPPGTTSLEARGGTWLYKAPEQISGPPGLLLAGQERTPRPTVNAATDVWALGTLICLLCNDGRLPSHAGLPFGLTAQQVLKWGDRPNGSGGFEPFYIKWEDVLPRVPCPLGSGSDAAASETTVVAAAEGAGGYVEPVVGPCSLARDGPVAEQAAQQAAHVMALLRRLAVGCLQPDPAHRLSATQVAAAAAEAIAQLPA